MFSKVIILIVTTLVLTYCADLDKSRNDTREEGEEQTNQVENSFEESDLNKVIKGTISPLSAYDIKCLTTDDKRNCSKKMKRTKGILIKVAKNNCAACSAEEKKNAGVAILSLLVHDRTALKLFLTKHKALKKLQEISNQ